MIFETRHGNFYLEQAGQAYKETIVMLHAGICDSRMWDAQFQYFSHQYHVVRYDMRGFGQTAPDMVHGKLSFHNDLYAVLSALEIEQAHVMGCSLGGRTAIDFALAYPDRIKSLVLVGGAISGFVYEDIPAEAEAAFEARLNTEMDEADDAGDLERLSELEVQLWVDGPHRTANAVDEDIRTLVREMNLIALQNEPEMDALPEDELEPPAVNRLGEIAAPCLVMVGDVDRAVSLARHQTLVADIANAQEIVIENAAHLPSMEHPDLFNKHVETFLESLTTHE